MSQTAKTKEQIQAIIDRISFRDRVFRLLEKGDGFLLQMSYHEVDINHPGTPPVLQSTRKWYVSQYSTETEIVETAYAMVCRSQLHVAAEHFNYKGRRVYSPHFHIDGRLYLATESVFDGREPIK